MICFLGSSHAALHLKLAAHERLVEITEKPECADVIFVSEDTPTDENGNRNLGLIKLLVLQAHAARKPIVLTSQVPPGFTRSLMLPHIYHQAETLRIKDARERAFNPDYIIIGCDAWQSYESLPTAYRVYLGAFFCPKLMVTYEEAEFSKIAVNMMLAAQVDMTNKLAAASAKVGASWSRVSEALKFDKRIGHHAYLEPGRWQDSKHLFRDYVTLEALSTS